jgi:hypothetical protein
MNRNYTRVLNEQQIKDIAEQVAYDLRQYPLESADTLVDHYLRGDAEGLLEVISSWIELAEDEVRRQLNTDLMEDSFDDEHIPHYDY